LEVHKDEFPPLLFIVVDQINAAKLRGGVDDACPQNSIYAKLNQRASENSSSVANFLSSLEYARRGISYLTDADWEHSFSLSLRLHQLASLACFKTGQHDLQKVFIDEIMKRSESVDDKLPSFLLTIRSIALLGNPDEAAEQAFIILEEVGQSFSTEELDPSLIADKLRSTKALLESFTPNEILNFRHNSSARMGATIR
jgi:hypothetical protein